MAFKLELDAAIQAEAGRSNSAHGWGCELDNVGPNRKLTIWSLGGFRETVIVPSRASMTDDDILQQYYYDTMGEVIRRRGA